MSSAFFASLVFVVIIVVCSAMSSYADQSQTQFEEFLLTLERNETEAAAANPHRHHHQTQSNAVTAVHSVDGVGVTRTDSPDGDSVSTSASTKGDEEEGGPLNGQTSNELLSYFKYVPRTHWSCCMLGLLAGNKGFQCRAEFYSSSVTLRNFNRPGRHSGGGPRDRTRGYEIMRTFRRCVTNNAHEFHRCCHVAVTERQELSVARSYWKNRSSSSR